VKKCKFLTDKERKQILNAKVAKNKFPIPEIMKKEKREDPKW
jgi:hypothetical protein